MYNSPDLIVWGVFSYYNKYMSKYLYGLTFGSDEEARKFKAKAQEKMAELNISVATLSKDIGYSRKSVYQFFSNNSIANKFLAAAIANKLNLYTF